MAHILVVDDQGYVRDVLRRLLESAGHDVTVARDGVEGLEAFRDRPADLVLCDLFMPNKDGLQTIEELRRGWPGVPVVAVSGGSADGEWDALPAAEALGAATLEKPFTAEALLALLERLLRAPEAAPGPGDEGTTPGRPPAACEGAPPGGHQFIGPACGRENVMKK
jgi:CheY-like chemotaxis protein